MKVICTEQLQTKKGTFRAGEEYTGNEINEHWWLIDSIGVETEEFLLHFELVEECSTQEVFTVEDAETGVIEEKKEEIIEENNPTWFERLTDYIFA